MNEGLKEAIKRINLDNDLGGTISLAHGEMTIQQENFFRLEAVEPDCQVSYIDGGQTTVFSSPTLHIEFIRVYSSTWTGRKRVKDKTQEYYLIVKTAKKDGTLGYSTETIPAQPEFPFFKLRDDTLATSNHNASIGAVANACRSISEYRMASELALLGGIVVKDGDLDTHHTGHKEAIAWAYQNAQTSGAKIIGISKTTNLLTETGASAISAILSKAPDGMWTYLDGRVGFCKLHARSEHIFRVDGADKNSIRMIAYHATDPAFLGYPYGLLEADARARVTLEEKKYLTALFEANTGEVLGALRTMQSAGDAHGTLDRMRY